MTWKLLAWRIFFAFITIAGTTVAARGLMVPDIVQFVGGVVGGSIFLMLSVDAMADRTTIGVLA
jgi:hypothetical protein